MTSTQVTTTAYRVLGTTDDFTTCELCGRSDLKGTIVLAVIDADGTDSGEIVYYGSDCGARAAGWTHREIRERAREADCRAAEAVEAERRAAHAADLAAFAAWVFDTYGLTIVQPADLWDKVPGMTPFAFRRQYDDARRR